MSKKPVWDWFKCYPEDWLADTREMTDAQARVYWDFLCLSYLRPDAIVRGMNDKWIAHELRCTRQKWVGVKRYLLRRGLLVATPCGGVANPRALAVNSEREALARTRADAAQERHKSPRLALWKNEEPLWKTGGRSKDARKTLESSFEVDPPMNCESANEINGGFVQMLTEARARPSDPKKEEEKTERQRMLPSDVVATLLDQEGTDKTERLIEDYQRSGMATNAKNLRNAFIGWLKHQHGIDLGHMKATKTKGPAAAAVFMAEILAQCGGNTTLPTAAQMAERARRVRKG